MKSLWKYHQFIPVLQDHAAEVIHGAQTEMSHVSMFHVCPSSQTEPPPLPYSNSDGQFPGGGCSSVSVAAVPFHPALLEHYLPQVPAPSHRAEGQTTSASLPRDRDRERVPYSEEEESDGGERSEGELVLLTDWTRGEGLRGEETCVLGRELTGGPEVLSLWGTCLWRGGDVLTFVPWSLTCKHSWSAYLTGFPLQTCQHLFFCFYF